MLIWVVQCICSERGLKKWERRKQLQAEILVILVVWRPRRAIVIVHFLVYFQFGVCVHYV